MRLKGIGAVAAAFMGVATLVAPPSSADFAIGNYDVLTNRYTRASWFWFVSQCIPERTLNCLNVSATPRLKYYQYYQSKVWLENGRYTFTVDVSDGLQCPGHVMPTRDTYSWDAVTLFGTIDSKYDVGCFNGPPGTQFWTFQLQRI